MYEEQLTQATGPVTVIRESGQTPVFLIVIRGRRKIERSDAALIDRQILDAIQRRQSARTFASTSVSKAAIRRILDGARHAPSGANCQPWHLLVVEDANVKREIRKLCEDAERRHHERVEGNIRDWYAANAITSEKPFLEQAPVLIATFFDPRAPYAIPSVWTAIAHMLLQATEEGLYTLPYTPSGARLAPLLGVPNPYRIAAVLPIGEAAPPVRQPRRPLSAVASLNRFGKPFLDE